MFLFIETYTIPDGQITYDAEVPIEVPENADPGDYHLFVALTDKEGWQTVKGFGLWFSGIAILCLARLAR